MNMITRFAIQLSFAAFMGFFGICIANAQSDAASVQKARGEFSGIAGGSGLLSFFDEGNTGDGVWGFKAGGFSRRRFGFEGSFEQGMREPGLRYLGGDVVFQFTKPDRKRIIPFLHVGAGSFLYNSRAAGALSVGAGIKQFFNERLGLRFGVQDRISIQSPEYQRIDFYAGIVVRF